MRIQTMQSGLTLILLAVALSACQQQISPNTYSVGSVGQVNRVVRGTVVSAREVDVAGTQGVGTAAGVAGGAVAGSAIGGTTRGQVLGAIGGAVAGGIAGAAVEGAATAQKGMEYVVQTENGALLTVLQGVDVKFDAGQKVLVLYGSRARIIADTTTPPQN